MNLFLEDEMSGKKILMMLAEGFEEMEAVVPADILRRLGFELSLVGLTDEFVISARGITLQADCILESAEFHTADAIVLPGGLPGATNLRSCPLLIDELKKAFSSGRVTAAICAAPIVLARAGLTAGKKVTGYPGTEKMEPGLVYTGNLVEVDGTVITGKGPGAAFGFAAAIAVALGTKQEEIDTLFSRMFVQK